MAAYGFALIWPLIMSRFWLNVVRADLFESGGTPVRPWRVCRLALLSRPWFPDPNAMSREASGMAGLGAMALTRILIWLTSREKFLPLAKTAYLDVL